MGGRDGARPTPLSRQGNTVAAREIADRVEGRVLQPIGGEDGGPVQVKWVVEHIGRREPKE
jgi:hypothetical protein